MNWVPIVFVIFKALMLGVGMFYAVKWHYDQGKKGREKEARAVLRASVEVAAVFALLFTALVFVTFVLGKRLGLDLAFP